MITVDLIHRDIAAITARASWWRRLLLGTRETTRFAVRVPKITGGNVWRYEDTGRLVDLATLRAISVAELERLRDGAISVAELERLRDALRRLAPST